MIKIDGFKEIDAALKQLEKSVAKEKISKIVADAAVPMEAEAKISAPVGGKTTFYKKQQFAPGRLRDSIHTIIKSFGGSTIADVKPKVPYAWLVEYGHKLVRISKKTGRKIVIGFAAPKPYMRPAFEKSYQKSLQILKNELEKLIIK